MTKEQTALKLMKEYLQTRVDRRRAAAQQHEAAGNTTLAMMNEIQADEADFALAYLLSLMHDEEGRG